VGLVFPSDLISHEFVLDENLIVLCGGDKEVGLSVSTLLQLAEVSFLVNFEKCREEESCQR
jgi:hypothetical protein